MENNVAFIAQLNVDFLFADFPRLPHLGEEVFAGKFDIQLGGGPQVMALVLDRLGIPTSLGMFYKNDTKSWLGIKLMEEYGYKNYVNLYDKLVEEDTDPAVVTSVFSFPEDRSFLSYNNFVYDNMMSDDDVYNFLKGSKICFAPNSANVLKKLHDDGSIIAFDTGWHEDLSIEKYAHILPYVDIFTPNDKEAMKMTGMDTPEDALMELANHVKQPIVKLGKDGCITIKDGSIIKVNAVDDFKAVDSTGAGDNFLAGVIFGIYNDWSIEKSMQMGNITGGYSTTALGCLAADITLDKAMGFLNKYYGD